MSLIAVAIVLVQMTGPDGSQRIDINKAEITSIREPRNVSRGHWALGTHCLIVTTSGKVMPVHEDCATVRARVGPPHSDTRGRTPCVLVCGGERGS
jgi:hypothetical protein